MSDPVKDPLEAILHQCASAAPDPWYPRTYAETTGVSRDSLDKPLEMLRLGGLIRLTEWVQGKGQGYALTPEGIHALRDPRALERVRDGKPLPSRQEVADRPPRNLSGRTTWDRGEEIRQALLFPTNPVVTKALLFANLLVFAAGYVLAGQNGGNANDFISVGLGGKVPTKVWKVLHETGAMSAEDIVRGEWWRLLSNCFVHIGLIPHLLFNMLALYVLGRAAEPMWGHGRYLVIYLVAGVGGSCGMLFETVGGGAGASGALCGILAAIGVWFLMNRRAMPSEIASRGLRSILINGVLIAGISLVPGVSWGAHLAGAIAGAAVAVFLQLHRYGRAPWRWLALAGVPLVPAASVGALVHTMKTDPRWIELRALHITDARDNRDPHMDDGKPRNDDARAFRGRYKREALTAEDAARDAYNHSVKLINQKRTERDPNAAKRAINELAEAQTKLATAEELLARGDPYTDAGAEQARKRSIEYMGAWNELCSLAESVLKGAVDAQELNARISEQLATVKELGNQLVDYIR
jgi:membrane associated rhomboid family serine protease